MARLALRAVLWDMDGVLVDSHEAHFQAWAATLAAEGIAFDRGIFLRLFGMNNRDTLASLLGRPPRAAELARINQGKEGRFRRIIQGHARMLPGVSLWLERFRAAGYRQAVASSAPLANIQAIVEELGIAAFFDALVTSHGLAGKPDPAVFLAAAQQLAVAPAQCLVIEDSLAGVEAAGRAGMTCIAVQTTNPATALSAATLTIPDLSYLTETMIGALQGGD